MFSILKPYIFSLDPETAHDLAIKSLKANFLPPGPCLGPHIGPKCVGIIYINSGFSG